MRDDVTSYGFEHPATQRPDMPWLYLAAELCHPLCSAEGLRVQDTGGRQGFQASTWEQMDSFQGGGNIIFPQNAQDGP